MVLNNTSWHVGIFLNNFHFQNWIQNIPNNIININVRMDKIQLLKSTIYLRIYNKKYYIGTDGLTQLLILLFLWIFELLELHTVWDVWEFEKFKDAFIIIMIIYIYWKTRITVIRALRRFTYENDNVNFINLPISINKFP